jgi:hypothetical protein
MDFDKTELKIYGLNNFKCHSKVMGYAHKVDCIVRINSDLTSHPTAKVILQLPAFMEEEDPGCQFPVSEFGGHLEIPRVIPFIVKK